MIYSELCIMNHCVAHITAIDRNKDPWLTEVASFAVPKSDGEGKLSFFPSFLSVFLFLTLEHDNNLYSMDEYNDRMYKQTHIYKHTARL